MTNHSNHILATAISIQLIIKYFARTTFLLAMQHKSVAERVNSCTDRLRSLRDAHEAGTYFEGPEALAAEVDRVVELSGLVTLENIDISTMGVYPGNREGSMLVPADVHGLLGETFLVNGFNPKKWDCTALHCTALQKTSWLEQNQALVASSDGLLPNIYEMTHATGIGSHGTAALRSVKVACKSVHASVAGADGLINYEKVVAMQPSLRKPIQQGVQVRVIKGELEEAVPGIFQILSRLGNVSNSHFRLQTTLQSCARIHNIAAGIANNGGVIDWAKVGRLASIGMSAPESENVGKLCSFVQNWAGSEKGEILRDLWAYEKTLTQKRFISASDLEVLGECDDQYHRIVPVHHHKVSERSQVNPNQ